MAEIDSEVIARAIRWCAAAGRHAGEAEVREALSPLSWDEMVAVKAVLADPPPARPLGPRALADIARGADPAEAAGRERDGRYRSERDFEGRSPAPGGAAATEPPAAPRKRGRKLGPAATVVVRRARDRAPEPPPAAPALLLLDELHRAEGRAVLERLVRRHGPRRAPLVDALRAGWRRADGTSPDEADLDALLDAHGLARAFERHERALLLHALRAAGGVRPRAAAAAGLAPAAWEAALARLGAGAEAEGVRQERRQEIRRRATLSERARLLLADEERLADLGVLDEIVADLAARLPDHLRALRAGAKGPLAAELGRSLSLSRSAVDALARRFGLDLGAARVPGGTPARDAGPPPDRSPRQRPARERPPRDRVRADRAPGARPNREAAPGDRPRRDGTGPRRPTPGKRGRF
jgi:hypothetical protein